MPSKIQLDENLWFLYICLQKSDYKNIDFNAVGAVTHLKAPAARMRYTRLRRQIESGTLIGTHGTPFQKGGGEASGPSGKRKRGGAGGGEGDDEEGVMGREVKTENKNSVDGDDGDAVEERVSSDDETPLAKRTTRLPPRATVGRVLEGTRYLTPQTSHRPDLPWDSPPLDTVQYLEDKDMPHSSADSDAHGG